MIILLLWNTLEPTLIVKLRHLKSKQEVNRMQTLSGQIQQIHCTYRVQSLTLHVRSTPNSSHSLCGPVEINDIEGQTKIKEKKSVPMCLQKNMSCYQWPEAQPPVQVSWWRGQSHGRTFGSLQLSCPKDKRAHLHQTLHQTGMITLALDCSYIPWSACAGYLWRCWQ